MILSDNVYFIFGIKNLVKSIGFNCTLISPHEFQRSFFLKKNIDIIIIDTSFLRKVKKYNIDMDSIYLSHCKKIFFGKKEIIPFNYESDFCFFINPYSQSVRCTLNDIYKIKKYNLSLKSESSLVIYKTLSGKTKREIDVMYFIKSGLNEEEIAKKLNISKKTVRGVIYRIIFSLGLKNKLELYSLLLMV